MAKYFHLLYFTFLSVSLFAQESQIPALTIYLEDAENGKNINNAKVTLEGFELPEITAKYNTKQQNYYFNEIPSGYTTVMTYHKKYNEKGFQNTTGLPKELKFKLFDPLNVSYGFDFFEDNLSIKNTYVEDPYKISVSSTNEMTYNLFKTYIISKIKELNLEIELVNPYWEVDKIEETPFFPDQKEAYPTLTVKETDKLSPEYLFPLKSGITNIFPDRKYSNKSWDICFMVRKKDGSKFKRFNDPVIQKLKEEKLNVYAVVLNKRNGADLINNLKIRDRSNAKFNSEHKIDSSKVFFYDSGFRNYKKSIFSFLKKKNQMILMEPNQYPQFPSFFLLRNDDYEIPRFRREIQNQYGQPIPPQDLSVGLGILDEYDYYLNPDVQ
ncbi:hypothetical protein D0809_08890 [Flavobacterium circumlabens]|uniref:Uncharacterized protein n=1 Tax=Flavobacterium circumlabens TaxID=2133765 RepID=A0A4Y7UFM7_9FLAO|nr:hypothetical protein [Flavobacterium circumlabens]TCN60034.1 hypothetical protein EV142_102654 [Flavobacterium circumlabens]TEB45270.1 hypothetical protein D0809_08890 [Flavobacterium circumlabens]